MEVLLYGSIESYSAESVIREINAITDGVCDIRVNTNGGSPEYGFGVIAKFAEFQGTKRVKVDGKAYSMGALMCAYADEVEALDVSEFMVHRAAYPEWYEKELMNPESSMYDEGLIQNLKNINASLEKAFLARIDVEKFEALKGVKVKDMFSLDARKDVWLTAQEAKSIGLVTKINKITPSKKAEIEALGLQIAASYNQTPPPTNPVQTQKTHKMTAEDFRKENPEAYAAIVNAGIQQERERVKAHLVYADVDLEAVTTAIKEGSELTPSMSAELMRKMASKGIAAQAAADTPPPTETPETPKPETPEAKADKEASEMEAKVLAELGIVKPENK